MLFKPYQEREKVCSIEEADALGFGLSQKGEKQFDFIPFKIPELQDDEVLIKVNYTGICHTDPYWAREEWGEFVHYPCVPGHEIIGTVKKVGKNVTKFKVGDHVGYGFKANACGGCEKCKHGLDNLCQIPDSVTFHKHFGGWATHYVGKESHGHFIPESVPLEKAANLFCAGVTVYAPMARHLKAGMKIGVAGIGGLGHLAVQFGHHMGCYVTGITGTESKKQEILDLGADDVMLIKDIPANQGKELLDAIIICFSDGDFDQYIKLLKMRGIFIVVGLPPADRPNRIDMNNVVLNEIKIVGSVVGSDDEIQATLEFAGKYKVFPTIEYFNWDDFPKALNKLDNGRPRYRMTVKVHSEKYPKFNE